MQTRLTEEQTLLQDSVRKFLEAEIPLTRVRELADDAAGLTQELWQKIADQGWLGLMIPEEYGGLGLGVGHLGVVCEEMGRLVTPGAYLSTVLAAHMIAQGGTEAAKQEWLPLLASGERVGTLALIEETAHLCRTSVQCKAVQSPDGYLLNGTKCLVADAMAADLFVVAAKVNEDANDWLRFFLIDGRAGGVTVKPNTLADLTSRNGQVYLENVVVTNDAVIDPAAYKSTLLVANVCIAANSIGGAEYIHKLTVAYAKERTQFGKLIGSFQAVKHPLVDLFAQNESARSAYHYAAWAVDAKSPDRKTAVAVARLTCTEAYRKTTLDCLQAHGGIAFTWEYDLHLYLKRAKHNQFLYGEARDYEEVICQDALGL